MSTLKRSIKWLLIPLSLLVLFMFLIVVVGQTAEIVQLADRISPTVGTAVLWTIVGIFALLIIVPAFVFYRLPRTLTLPDEASGPEYDRYLQKLADRLSANPIASAGHLVGPGEIGDAVHRVNVHCDAIIRETAATVFLVTSVSQSGRFDALTVLGAQSRMILAIAKAYYQRPSARQLLHLYANVAGTALIASELDDLNVEEQVQPILDASLGGILGVIPGASVIAALITNMVLNGSANAFFTLRVGVIAKRYCGAVIKHDRRAIRRAASAEAITMLRPVISNGSSKLSRAVRDQVARKFSRSGKPSPSVVERRNAELEKRRWWHALQWSRTRP